MQIKRAKSSDIETLASLDSETNLTPWSYQDYLGSFHNSQQFIYLLSEHGRILGCLVVGIALDEAEILQFWIRKNCRTKGYGRYLLNHVLGELSTKFKIVQVFLEVREGNMEAINLYQNSGFNQVGKRNDYYNVDVWQFDAMVMLKHLKQQ